VYLLDSRTTVRESIFRQPRRGGKPRRREETAARRRLKVEMLNNLDNLQAQVRQRTDERLREAHAERLASATWGDEPRAARVVAARMRRALRLVHVLERLHLRPARSF
jgi:hypothetical protein